MEIVDESSAVGGRVFLLPLDDLLHDDIKAGVVFDGVPIGIGDGLPAGRRVWLGPFPGLWGRGNEPRPGRDRSGLGVCGLEPGGGGLCPLGPVCAPACLMDDWAGYLDKGPERSQSPWSKQAVDLAVACCRVPDRLINISPI